MSEQWPVKTLDNLINEGVITLGRGKIISRKDLVANPGTYPVYSSAKQNEGRFGEYGLYMFDEELITWSVDGGGRLFHREKHKFSVTNVGGTLRINDTGLLDYKFLYYCLTLLHSKINFDWVKKAHPSIIRKLYNEIPIPPLEEQQRIVKILDEAFDNIRESMKTIEKQNISSEENYRSASKSIFEESGEDWIKTTLGQICTLQRGFDLPKRLRVQGEFSLVSASGVIDTHNIAKVTGPGVITGRSGTIGKVNYVENDFWPLNTALYVKDFHGNHPRFIYHFLIEFGLERFSGGTGVPTLNRNLVHPVEVMIPSTIEEQIEIVERLDLLNLETKNYQTTLAEKKSLKIELKQSILKEAFDGNL